MVRRILLAVQCSLAILSLSVVFHPLWAQEDDPTLRARFLKGVAETATKLETLSFRSEIAYTSSAKGKTASGKTDTMNLEVALRGPYGLETGLSKRTGTVFFRVRNGSYAFALDRSPKGDRTSLQFVEQLGVDPAIDAQIVDMEETPRAFVLAAFYLWTDPLFRLVESDLFTIKRVYPVTSGDDELVRVEFEFIVNDQDQKPKYRCTDGFLVCDPARNWVLTEYGGDHYHFRSKSTSVHGAVLECEETVGGIPMATKVTRTFRSSDNDYHGESMATVGITSRDVPEEEFYLSYYGLPEPNFGQSWFGAWGWYLILGIGCIVVGAITIKWRNTQR